MKSIKIETKFTVLLTLVSGFSLLLCMLVSYFAIQPGLKDLFAHIELKKIEPWARSLEIVYKMEGSWDAVSGQEKNLFPDAQIMGPTALESRIRLFDAQGKQILGQPGSLEKSRTLVLEKEGKVIGYLALEPPKDGYLDQEFAETYLRSQLKTVLVVGFLILCLSVMVARVSPLRKGCMWRTVWVLTTPVAMFWMR